MSRLRGVWRGLIRHCPYCGGRGIFRRWMTLVERCPTCGVSFEREEGYWVGAMIVNLGAAQIAFFILFIGGMLATWPDVAWTLLLIVGLVVMAIVPVVAYPISKSVWIGIDLALHPPGPDDVYGSPTSGDLSR